MATIKSIEEKAKAYDEAVEKLRRLHDDYDTVSTLIDVKKELENIFPELAVSDDEMIRKELLDFCKNRAENYPNDPKYKNISAWIAWLEKQGEKPTDEEMKEALRTEYEKGRADAIAEMQKPAWSEEDEAGLGDAMWAIEQARTIAKDENDMGNLWYAERWLKSLKERVQPQQKVEWGEEDERKINRIYSILGQAADTHAFSTTCRLIGDKECIELQDFLKSLKDRYTWKPSDKQLNALHDAAVYEHLNKLREK